MVAMNDEYPTYRIDIRLGRRLSYSDKSWKRLSQISIRRLLLYLMRLSIIE